MDQTPGGCGSNCCSPPCPPQPVPGTSVSRFCVSDGAEGRVGRGQTAVGVALVPKGWGEKLCPPLPARPKGGCRAGVGDWVGGARDALCGGQRGGCSTGEVPLPCGARVSDGGRSSCFRNCLPLSPHEASPSRRLSSGVDDQGGAGVPVLVSREASPPCSSGPGLRREPPGGPAPLSFGLGREALM